MSERKFTVSIGNYGTKIVLHEGSKIVKDLFFESSVEENKSELDKLFNQNKDVGIYILLDNIDQNYKKKSYSPFPKSDLLNLVKRDLNKEFPSDNKEMIKGHLIRKDPSKKGWEVFLISSSDTKEVSSWTDYIMQLPNKLEGIYMLPIEVYSLLKSIRRIANNDLNIGKKSNISFVITRNQVSGIRQIVFSENNIAFTRVISYDFEDPKFAAKFEQDIFRTNEYLKRLFPELKMQDVIIFNVLEEAIIEKIKLIQNKDLNFINYLPYQVASKLGMSNSITSEEKFSDNLIANFFAREKNKILKFKTPRSLYLEKLYLAIKSAFFCKIGLAAAIIVTVIAIFSYKAFYKGKLSELATEKQEVEKKFEGVKSMALDGDEKKDGNLQIDEIMDFGKINDALSKVDVDISQIYAKLRLIKNFNAMADKFNYSIKNYNPKSDSGNPQITFSLSGKISNQTGDVEDMFKKFDGLSLEAKNSFSDYDIKLSEIPKDVDFGKKYYEFPFNLDVNSR